MRTTNRAFMGVCRSTPLLVVCVWAGLAGVPLACQSDQELFQRGEACCQNREYDQAIECFSKAIRLNAAEAKYYDGRGLARLHKADPDRALKDFNQALRLDARFAPAYLHRGYVYSHQKDFDKAIADFTRAIEIEGDSTVAYYALCRRAFAKCKLTKPSDHDKLGQGQEPPGMADVAAAIKLRPNLPDAYFLRGDLLHKYLGDLSGAKKDYDKAVEIEPTRMEILGFRGILQYLLEAPWKAVADLTAAIELDPKYAAPHVAVAYDAELAKVYSNRGVVYADLGYTAAALHDYGEAMRLAPDDPVPYVNRARVYAEDLEKRDEAIADCSRAIEIDPKLRAAYRSRGCCLADQGRLDEALADFTEAIRLEPEDARGYFDRGTVYDEKGDFAKALEDYTKAISLKPEKTLYWNNRGCVYCDLKDFEKAIADFTAGIRHDPKDYSLWVNRGIAYLKMENWEKAISDFCKDIELRPWSVSAYERRGAAFEMSGQPDKAKADFQKAEEYSRKMPWELPGFLELPSELAGGKKTEKQELRP